MTNKEVVEKMYEEFFNAHDIDAALKYVREDYIQHNPGVGQGRVTAMRMYAVHMKHIKNIIKRPMNFMEKY